MSIKRIATLLLGVGTCLRSGLLSIACLSLLLVSSIASNARAADDLLFIHHSVGENWLNQSLRDALIAKTYINDVNEITYGTDVAPDSGRPDSLGPVPGDNTDLQHWILWFNDYLGSMKAFGVASGDLNRIIMFKSCFPNSDIADSGIEPGDPVSSDRTLANYRAVYRHPSGAGNVFTIGGVSYRPLEDVFAANPNTLFIVVTAPPQTPLETTDAMGHNARLFNEWIKGEWLASYRTAHPELANVTVFDLFDALANPDGAALNPNRLADAYQSATDPHDSHPNDVANAALTGLFATASGNFLDAAWNAFVASAAPQDTTGTTGADGGTAGGSDGGSGQGEGTSAGQGTTSAASSCSFIPPGLAAEGTGLWEMLALLSLSYACLRSQVVRRRPRP